MSKNLKKFGTLSAYNTARANDQLFKPSVSLIDETKEVKYDTFPKPVQPNKINLGLSVQWADSNIGATNGSTYDTWWGNFYAWGEIEPKSTYNWENYSRHTNGTYSQSNQKVFTKYVPTSGEDTYWAGEGHADNKLVLDPVDDIATVSFGAGWRLPTVAECEELESLISVWVTNYQGVSNLQGRLITGLNGVTMFLPAAGFYESTTHIGKFVDGSYITSSLSFPAYNYYLHFSETDNPDVVNGNERMRGISARPVYDPS